MEGGRGRGGPSRRVTELQKKKIFFFELQAFPQPGTPHSERKPESDARRESHNTRAKRSHRHRHSSSQAHRGTQKLSGGGFLNLNLFQHLACELSEAVTWTLALAGGAPLQGKATSVGRTSGSDFRTLVYTFKSKRKNFPSQLKRCHRFASLSFCFSSRSFSC